MRKITPFIGTILILSSFAHADGKDGKKTQDPVEVTQDMYDEALILDGSLGVAGAGGVAYGTGAVTKRIWSKKIPNQVNELKAAKAEYDAAHKVALSSNNRDGYYAYQDLKRQYEAARDGYSYTEGNTKIKGMSHTYHVDADPEKAAELLPQLKQKEAELSSFLKPLEAAELRVASATTAFETVKATTMAEDKSLAKLLKIFGAEGEWEGWTILIPPAIFIVDSLRSHSILEDKEYSWEKASGSAWAFGSSTVYNGSPLKKIYFDNPTNGTKSTTEAGDAH